MINYNKKFSEKEREKYENMLKKMSEVSKLFSNNNKPFLDYRITENFFCKFLKAKNVSRDDNTIDAKKDSVGYAIKTWVKSNKKQKIAEFDKNKREYELLPINDMIKKISELRNNRIKGTKDEYGTNKMIYHCVIRDIGCIILCECELVPIDIKNIKDIRLSKNSIHFTDGRNDYTFYKSKSTLFMAFDNLKEVKRIPVEILDKSQEHSIKILKKIMDEITGLGNDYKYIGTAVLPLYTPRKREKIVPARNNINMRFSKGRKRNYYEVGIPIPAKFRNKHKDFFPLDLDKSFDLILPDKKILLAKRCQQGGKSLMTNPNKALGHWLIDEVLKVDARTVITYRTLLQKKIDAVKLQKYENSLTGALAYRIDFAYVGSYEAFMEKEH